MKFDMKWEQRVVHGEHNDSLVTEKRMEILREDFFSLYGEDETCFFNTLREIIYMFHFVNGFITQVSDTTMQEMYDALAENPSYKGLCYLAEETEILSDESEYDRKKSVRIDLIYLQ